MYKPNTHSHALTRIRTHKFISSINGLDYQIGGWIGVSQSRNFHPPSPKFIKPPLNERRPRYVAMFQIRYGLDDRDSIPGRYKVLSLLHRVQTISAPNQPIKCVPGTLSLGTERPRREADHSPLSSAEVK